MSDKKLLKFKSSWASDKAWQREVEVEFKVLKNQLLDPIQEVLWSICIFIPFESLLTSFKLFQASFKHKPLCCKAYLNARTTYK